MTNQPPPWPNGAPPPGSTPQPGPYAPGYQPQAYPNLGYPQAQAGYDQEAPAQPYPTGYEQRDPRAAFGAPPPQHVSIDEFANPKPKLGVWLGLAAALVVIVGLIIGFAVLRPVVAPATATPTPTAPTVPTPSHSPGTNGSDWQSRGGSSGWWEVLEESWQGNHVTVKVRLECAQKCPTRFELYAFDDAGGHDYTPSPSGRQPDVRSGLMPQGRTEGYVEFDIPRGPATLIMVDGNGNPVSALKLKG